MSNFESQIQKKKGLAKLAKARSISDSLNTLSCDSEQENKDDDGNVLLAADSFSLPRVLLTFPNPVSSLLQGAAEDIHPQIGVISSDIHEGYPDNISTPEKPSHVAEKTDISSVNSKYLVKDSCKENNTLSTNNKKDSGSDQDVTSTSKDAGKGKLSKKSFLQSLNRKSLRRKKPEKKEKSMDRSESPSPSRSQLDVPKLKTRSRSLCRLSDAINNIHNACMTPTNTAQYFESQQRTGRPISWNSNDHSSFEDDESSEDLESQSRDSEVSDELSRRWSSLGHLSGEASPLYQVKLSEAKQKNYLFGGLGSLLGATELDRYFPDRKVVIFIATWNMNGKEPPYTLDDFLLPDDMEHMPDMFVIGTQESGGDRTEWEVRLQTTIGPSHVLFHSAVLGILHLTVFLRRDLVWFCSVPEEGYHSLRPGTYFKTKGAIGIGFQFFGTKMLFVNTHLFAHEEKLQQRIQNYKNITHNLDLPRNLKFKTVNKPKDVTNRYDIVFWMGDLNFRLVGPRDEILERTKDSKTLKSNIEDILCFDQLSQAKNRGEIFQGFSEGAINFAPTFKFDVGTNHYDSSSKQRVPSYTDRILFKSTRDPIRCSNYNSCPHFKTSDHKPVWGVFHFKVRPGKDDVPLAAGLFQREVYLTALKRRRRFFYQPSSKNCQMQ